MIVDENTHFDAEYDVIVLGFGGAGATAARFAADAGSKVLLVDSAPEGHEGGNTRYCAQLVAYGKDKTDYMNYYQHLAQHFNLDTGVTETLVDGVSHMEEYFQKYLGVKKPVSFKKDILGKTENAIIADHPEFPGAKSYDMITPKNVFDAGLWKILKQKVVDRSEKIDVWYSAPVQHLLQTSDQTVVGAQIERDHVLLNIHAKNGVVLTTGGFENNPQMIQDYIGAYKLVPLGGLYNKGKGIDLAHEVGANMWHMTMYSSAGFQHNFAFWEPELKRAVNCMNRPQFNSGSIFTIGDDGTRYFQEDEPAREGYVNFHGTWYTPANQLHPHIVFDEKQYKEIQKLDKAPYNMALNHVIKADSIQELAQLIDVPVEKLQKTVDEFNFFAKEKHDYAFHREPESLAAFSTSGPYYAIPVVQTICWSEGGPQRNSRAEIIDPFNRPIPHLYGAGELGSSVTNLYQGGTSLANCLIFGKIAGQNAAHQKDATIIDKAMLNHSAVSTDDNLVNELLVSDLKTESYSVGKDQYIGKSNKGIGGEIVVRVTADNKKNLKGIEILKQAESDEYGLKAIKDLPNEMVKQNTYEVDTVSGASNSSRGIKDAVKDALSHIE